MARLYPALELRWPAAASPAGIDHMLAALDDDAPTAVEEIDDGLRVFFASSSARDRAAASASARDPSVSAEPVDVSDDDWAERSQSSLGPVRVGRILVVDTRSRLLTTPGVVTVIIHPSMGFGTGHHASTRLCLRLLQDLELHGARVLDVGTGSGVLAIAARKLGAGDVVGTDIDPDALRSAEENLDLNGERDGVRLVTVDLAEAGAAIGPAFDVVLANLTGAVLVRHAIVLAALTRPGGHLVVGGFETHEVEDVHGALGAAGLRPDARADEDGWVGLVRVRKA